ncbi:MAG: hypothetical protein ACRDPE_00400 [Solirubrobacterales bacterium]
MPASKRKPKFALGEWAVLTTVGTRWDVQVVEDWGEIGVNGERIYSVLVSMEEGAEPIMRSAKESRLVPVAQPSVPRSAQHF